MNPTASRIGWNFGWIYSSWTGKCSRYIRSSLRSPKPQAGDFLTEHLYELFEGTACKVHSNKILQNGSLWLLVFICILSTGIFWTQRKKPWHSTAQVIRVPLLCATSHLLAARGEELETPPGRFFSGKKFWVEQLLSNCWKKILSWVLWRMLEIDHFARCANWIELESFWVLQWYPSSS